MATGTTLNPGDNLVGNGGNDALNITLSGDPTTASTYIIQTATIETINLGNYDTATGTDATFNLASASGLTNLNVTGGDGDTVATGLTAAVVLGSSSATGNLSVTYASGVLSGTADTQSVTLTNFGLEADSPTLTIADASGAAAIAETLAVTSSGTANYLTIAASNNHTKLTVTGSGALTVDGNADTTLKTIDASASTGGVSITNIGASNLTMTGGSGSDLLRIDGSTINKPRATGIRISETLKLTDDKSALFNGLLEIIYQVRCQLVHGQIEPKAENHEVVKQCYFLLHELMDF